MAEGDVYRMRCVWKRSANGAAAVNDFYFEQFDPTIIDTPAADLFQAFQLTCQAAYEALVSSLLSTVEIQFGRAPDFLTEEVFTTPFFVGQLSGDPLPGFSCGILSRYSEDLTRRGRGRLYIPAATEAVNSNGAPTAGYFNDLQDFGDSMMPYIGDGVTTSRWGACVWSVADQESKRVVSFRARSIWGVQRDRRNLFLA